MKQIGLFGGSFDPIHNAHLNVARHAVTALDLDTVLFMPSGGHPYYKDQHLPADSEARLIMVRLAIQGEPYFEVSDYEILQDQYCYTIDTLRYLQLKYKDQSEIVLLAGSDWKDKIPHWKDGEKLLQEFHVAYFSRPGTVQKENASEDCKEDMIEIPMLDISSSLIRERIQEGHSIEEYVPKSVDTFIQQNQLYR